MKVQGIAPEGLSPAIKKKKKKLFGIFDHSIWNKKKKNIKKGSVFPQPKKKKKHSLSEVHIARFIQKNISNVNYNFLLKKKKKKIEILMAR